MSKLKALSLLAVAALTSSIAVAEEMANTTTTENTVAVTEEAKTENTAAK